MKIFMKLFIAFMLVFAGTQLAYAQELSKEEAKQWKNLANEYRKNPAELKQLTEERNEYRDQVESLRQQTSVAQTQLQQEQNRSAQLEQENAQLKNTLMATQQMNEDLVQRQQEMEQMMAGSQPAPTETGMDNTMMGTVFRVQVGAYKPGSVPSKFNQYPDVYIEDAGDLQKVLIGAYRNYEDAQTRLGQLKREGYPSAWIVAFRDGNRIPVKEALQN